MLIDERQMTRFPARRTFKKIWIMIAGFGVFIAIGLALYFGTGERTALLTVAFGGVFTLALIIVFVAPHPFAAHPEEAAGYSESSGAGHRENPSEKTPRRPWKPAGWMATPSALGSLLDRRSRRPRTMKKNRGSGNHGDHDHLRSLHPRSSGNG